MRIQRLPIRLFIKLDGDTPDGRLNSFNLKNTFNYDRSACSRGSAPQLEDNTPEYRRACVGQIFEVFHGAP